MGPWGLGTGEGLGPAPGTDKGRVATAAPRSCCSLSLLASTRLRERRLPRFPLQWLHQSHEGRGRSWRRSFPRPFQTLQRSACSIAAIFFFVFLILSVGKEPEKETRGAYFTFRETVRASSMIHVRKVRISKLRRTIASAPISTRRRQAQSELPPDPQFCIISCCNNLKPAVAFRCHQSPQLAVQR